MTKKFFYLFLIICLQSLISAAQSGSITISGIVRSKSDKSILSFANILLKKASDSSFVTGTISNEAGRFTLTNIAPGNYILELTYAGYVPKKETVQVGSLSNFLDLAFIEMERDAAGLQEVVVSGTREGGAVQLDKKSFQLASNVSQAGGSVLQALRNLPGITTSQDGKVELRGSDKVAILIDGKQTALTGFGNQTGLDNIPASAIERIEIINNPSSKYDANGNAGIINIIYKKNRQEGLNGKIGLSTGVGALWVKRQNLPTIRPQYTNTPKINPSIALFYKKNKINTFLQADWLYTETLNKNEFVTRSYDNGNIINQQTKRNRNTHFVTTKAGFDWEVSSQDILTISGLFGIEKIIDRGDEPFFDRMFANDNIDLSLLLLTIPDIVMLPDWAALIKDCKQMIRNR